MSTTISLPNPDNISDKEISLDEKIAPHSSDSGSNLETGGVVTSKATANKFDKNGFPLIPQPTDSKDDPLNWPYPMKLFILVQIGFLALFCIMNLTFMQPSVVLISKYFHVSTEKAAWPSSIPTAGLAVGGFVWVPLSNVYGRRPVILFCSAMIILCTGFSTNPASFAKFIVSRTFSAFFISGPISIGPGVVSDVFFLHERGTKMGFFTVLMANAPHLAIFCGGFIAQYTSSWLWSVKIPLIINSIWFVVNLCCLPETKFVRSAAANVIDLKASDSMTVNSDELTHGESSSYKEAIIKRLKPWGVKTGRSLQVVDFFRPFQMLIYPNVLFICIYMSIGFTFSALIPGLTISSLFPAYYHWKFAKLGVGNGLSTTLGGIIGELYGGHVLDWLMRGYRRGHDGRVVPEARLTGMIVGAICMPLGLLLFGEGIQRHTTMSYVVPLVGAGIAALGVQVQTTGCYTYLTDCYKAQSTECGLLLNFARQSLGCSVGFWAIDFGKRVGFDKSAILYACLQIVLFFPIIWVRFYGEGLRAKMGSPSWNKGI